MFYLTAGLRALLSDENGAFAHRAAHRDQGKRHLGLYPHSVISITDGQILETDLFYPGSVPPSTQAPRCLGWGSAQIRAMRRVAGTLRINLAQFRELEAFAQFGSELDATSQAQLEQGRRVVEVLKQPQFQPVPVEEQVLAIFAVTNGLMDSVPVRDIRRFETEMREYVRTRHRPPIDSMSETGDFPKDAEGEPDTSELGAAIGVPRDVRADRVTRGQR